MEYKAYKDFFPSLRDFYYKNHNYRKAATKVLAAWSKSQHQSFFHKDDIFSGFQLTNYGENRIDHCIKYDLYNHSRLITYQNKNHCIFLFIGTHEEASQWLEKNYNLSFSLEAKTNEFVKEPVININTPIKNSSYQISYLRELRDTISDLKTELNQYKDYFKQIDTNDQKLSGDTYHKLQSQFLYHNKSYFLSELQGIKKLTITRNTKSAIKAAEDLELFSEFLKTKIKYINTLKNYIETYKNLH